jgi:transposase-like protein
MVNLIKLTNLLDEAKCYEVIRQPRWPDGVVCLHCRDRGVVRNGHNDRERSRQRYLCKACKYRFDDLTGTVLAGHHQQASTWILGSYFMGVNLSNSQIAQELSVCESDAQTMTEVLRYGIVANKPEVVLSRDVEFDEESNRNRGRACPSTMIRPTLLCRSLSRLPRFLLLSQGGSTAPSGSACRPDGTVAQPSTARKAARLLISAQRES